MIASKVVCDDTYSNKSWAVVGQGMFQLKEINQMEREMCGYLEWQLNVDYLQLEEFTEDVQTRFGNGLVPITKASSSAAAAASNKLAGVPSIPGLVSASSASAPAFAGLVPVSAASRREQQQSSYSSSTSHGTPSTLITTSAGGEEEDEDDFESPSHSLTSSPADSALHTPPSNADVNPAVVVAGGANLGMQGVNASISASAYNHLHHAHHQHHPHLQQLHGIPKMMATGGAPMPMDIPPIIATSASGASIPVGAAKLGNGRGVFAEQAIW
jgi:hypothetical protein